jgi:putative aldouronate transport system permease protein
MQKAIPIPVNARITWHKIVRNWQLYIMIAPAVLLIFIFNYIPMAGVQIAFRDYNPIQGIWGSPWVGLKNFEDSTIHICDRLFRLVPIDRK